MKHERQDHEMDNNTESINDAIKALMIDVRFLSPSLLDQDNINMVIFIIFFGAT